MTETIPLVDTWVVGDTIKDFEYGVLKRDGSAYNLTGHTAKLQGRSRDDRTHKIDANAALSGTPADGLLTFSSLGTVMVLGASRRSEVYVCRFKVTRTSDGKIGFTEWFGLGILPDPLA